MLTQRLANIVFAIVVIVICGYFFYLAQGFKTAGLLATSGLPSKFFPQLLLGCTALCAILVAIQYAKNGYSIDDKDETVFEDKKEARRGLSMLAVAVFSYIVWILFGFLPMALLMGPLSLLSMGAKSIWIYITVVLLTVFTYLIFSQLLGVQLG